MLIVVNRYKYLKKTYVGSENIFIDARAATLFTIHRTSSDPLNWCLGFPVIQARADPEEKNIIKNCNFLKQ
jgi:hypothetical protein